MSKILSRLASFFFNHVSLSLYKYTVWYFRHFIIQEKAETEEVHEKAVVVSQWTSMLNILKHHIIEQGLKFTEITGQVTYNSHI